MTDSSRPRPTASGSGDALERAAASVGVPAEAVRDTAEAVKPHLRGWLHAGIFPLALGGGLALVVISPTGQARLASAVYALTAALLFGVSATYHRGRWSPRVQQALKRFDHANIFLIIAGTYTPFAMLLLEAGAAASLLWIVWTGASLGVVFRVLWVGAPRWLYTPVYIALGWVAVFYLGAISEAGGAAVVTLLAAGGALYSAGAVVYGIKRPNPWPRWFGFHEVFHALTLGAFLCHYAAVFLVVSAAR